MACSRTLTLAFLLASTSGLVYAGPGDVPTDSWLYPRVTFEDGRSRESTGLVSATPSGKVEFADPEMSGIISACFAEGSKPTPEQMMALEAILRRNDGYDDRYNASTRIGGGSTGDPVNLTWSLVPDGTSWDGVSSIMFSRMDTLFGAGNRATWINRIQSVFDRWQAVSGLNYTRVTVAGQEWDDGAAWGSVGNDTTRGDIRIGMRNIDGVNGILAYNQLGGGADMVVDSSENWNTGGTYVFLRNTIAHEHGHGMGLAHVCPANGTKLMEPALNTSFDGPRIDDIRAAQCIYGDVYELNDTIGAAYDMATLSPGTTTTLGTLPAPLITGVTALSLNPNVLSGGGVGNEQDWFKFTLAEPKLVTITVTPQGTAAYTDVDQNGDGSCQSSGVTTDPLRQADLSLSVRASNGTTIYRDAAANGLGVAESVTSLLVNNGVSSFMVTGQASFAGTQMYLATVTILSTNLASSATDDTFTDKVRVTWPAIPNATGYVVRRHTADQQLLSSNISGTLGGGITTYDDTTAVPGTQYYYWVQAQQTGSTGFRYMTLAGEPGRRAIANVPPVANAGPDQNVTDADNSGSETVTLNGSASSDSDGTIVNYLWKEGAATLSSSASPTANIAFTVGVHTVTLTVTDDDGAVSTPDTVIITVEAPPPGCDPDYDQNGVADQDDIAYLINVIGGGDNPTGRDPDFDQNGIADQDDVNMLIGVIAGNPC